MFNKLPQREEKIEKGGNSPDFETSPTSNTTPSPSKSPANSSSATATYSNKFLDAWMEYTAGSETPELFNLWSGISALSATMGRRYVYKEGRLVHWPNMFIVIVGPAAVRKSSGGKLAASIIRRKVKNVRFGPTDTAGKKQGLLSAFIRGWGDTEEETEDEEAPAKKADAEAANLVAALPTSFSLAGLISGAVAGSTPTPSGTEDKPEEPQTTSDPTPTQPPVNNPFAALKSRSEQELEDEATLKSTKTNPRELYVFADEFTTFIGLNQIDMTNCLTHLYYPSEDYVYTLAKSEKRIPYPCLSILGCTTPVALASHLPPQAIGQGLTSRCIFVYESNPGAKVFPPPELDEALANKLASILLRTNSKFFNEFHAEDDITYMDRTEEAFNEIARIYSHKKIDLNDSRFLHYEQRRNEHLCKLAMVLAVGDERTTIELKDVQLADSILSQTEINMPQALGEIGLDKISQAKQELKEYLMNSWPMGVHAASFERNAKRHMSTREYTMFVSELVSTNQIRVASRNINGVEIQVLIPAKPKDKASVKKLLAGKSISIAGDNTVTYQENNSSPALPANNPMLAGIFGGMKQREDKIDNNDDDE